jgi:hypothetical protein
MYVLVIHTYHSYLSAFFVSVGVPNREFPEILIAKCRSRFYCTWFFFTGGRFWKLMEETLKIGRKKLPPEGSHVWCMDKSTGAIINQLFGCLNMYMSYTRKKNAKSISFIHKKQMYAFKFLDISISKFHRDKTYSLKGKTTYPCSTSIGQIWEN